MATSQPVPVPVPVFQITLAAAGGSRCALREKRLQLPNAVLGVCEEVRLHLRALACVEDGYKAGYNGRVRGEGYEEAGGGAVWSGQTGLRPPG